MKITIIIEKDEETIIKVDKKHTNNDPQTSLNDFGHVYIPPLISKAVRGTKLGMHQPKYREGRKIHECFRCHAPHRHNNLALGGCVECRELDEFEATDMRYNRLRSDWLGS